MHKGQRTFRRIWILPTRLANTKKPKELDFFANVRNKKSNL
jgi:hypothetical protein